VTHACLFREANVFDGRSATLLERADVLVEGDTITAVHQGRLDVAEGVTIVDCAGRTLMPGLIDLHTHPSFNLPVDRTTDATLWLRGMSLAKTLEMYLAQGFTTIRETGGACTAETAGSWPARACIRPARSCRRPAATGTSVGLRPHIPA
jgi:imidazolonepropionase-like amidohydrolase